MTAEEHPRLTKRTKRTALIPYESPPAYVSALNASLLSKPGTMLTLETTVQKKCKRFSINFVCDKINPDELPDIAFHFNPRMEQRCIIRNCRINGCWGEEERSSNMPFTIQVEKKLIVQVFITERAFMVAIDCEHWCSFTYRLPLTSIKNLEIRGMVDVQNVKLTKSKIYPENANDCIPIQIGDNPEGKKLPFSGKLPQPLGMGWEIEVNARLKLLPQCFFINLQESPQLWPHPNIPLHLNPRFNAMNGIDVFAINAWYDGGWLCEEIGPILPLLPGSEFSLQIRQEFDSFTIWLQEKLVGEYRFKCPVTKILYVYILGDVELRSVSMKKRDRTPLQYTRTKSKRTERNDAYP